MVTIVTNNGAPSPLVSGDGGQRMAISVAKSSAVVWLIASDCRASVILAGVAGVLDLVGLIGLGEGEVFGVVADGRGDGSFEGGGDGSVEAGGGQQVGPEGEPLGDGDGRGDGRPAPKAIAPPLRRHRLSGTQIRRRGRHRGFRRATLFLERGAETLTP